MAAKNLTIGENYISEVDLVDSDGNSVTRASIETMTVKIMQHRRVIESIVKPHARLTDGTTDSKQKIEVSTATGFREGKVYARVVSGDTDALYTVGGARISMPDYHILTMYSQLPADDETVTDVIDHWRGSYDASGNAAPSSGGSGDGGAILAGDEWVLSVAGTIFGTPRSIGDRITALVNNPGQTSGNWSIQGSQL